MDTNQSSWMTDDHGRKSRWSTSRADDERGTSRFWSQLSAFGDRLRGRRGERTSGEVTTQAEAGTSRGQALREAHRTLADQFRKHPALRQVTPHLAAVERALRKHGSRALFKMPIPVLRRALEQLTMLQRDDETSDESARLRVFRLRLLEAIALRSAREHHAEEDASARSGSSRRAPRAPSAGEPDSQLEHHDILRGKGVEVRHLSTDEFERAARDAKPPRLEPRH